MPKGIRMRTYAKKKLDEIESSKIIKEHFEKTISKIKTELKKIKSIDAVVLFGSFARGDYSDRHSDIDIMVFLDEDEKNPKLEEKILKKVIQLSVGKLTSVHTVFQYKKIKEEDASLLLTISDEGKTVFSRKSIIINKDILGLKSHHVIRFDSAGVNQIRKNKLQRFLYGYSVNGKKYKGLVDGEKVTSAGKGAIIVPKEILNKVLLFADSIGIKAKQLGRFYK